MSGTMLAIIVPGDRIASLGPAIADRVLEKLGLIKIASAWVGLASGTWGSRTRTPRSFQPRISP
jgi:hypothetical protein